MVQQMQFMLVMEIELIELYYRTADTWSSIQSYFIFYIFNRPNITSGGMHVLLISDTFYEALLNAPLKTCFQTLLGHLNVTDSLLLMLEK